MFSSITWERKNRRIFMICKKSLHNSVIDFFACNDCIKDAKNMNSFELISFIYFLTLG